MIEFLIFIGLGYYFFNNILPKIRRRFNKNIKEPTPISFMFLEYFAAHRRMLVFTVFTSIFGIWFLILTIFSNIAGSIGCFYMIIDDRPMADHSGICGILQWLM